MESAVKLMFIKFGMHRVCYITLTVTLTFEHHDSETLSNSCTVDNFSTATTWYAVASWAWDVPYTNVRL